MRKWLIRLLVGYTSCEMEDAKELFRLKTSEMDAAIKRIHANIQSADYRRGHEDGAYQTMISVKQLLAERNVLLELKNRLMDFIHAEIKP